MLQESAVQLSVLIFNKFLCNEFFCFDWDPLHARLKSRYKKWSYKKKKKKKVKRKQEKLFRKNLKIKVVY